MDCAAAGASLRYAGCAALPPTDVIRGASARHRLPASVEFPLGRHRGNGAGWRLAMTRAVYLVILAVALRCVSLYFRRVQKLVALVVVHYPDAVQKYCGISADRYQDLHEQQSVERKLSLILATRQTVPPEIEEALKAKRFLGRICSVLFISLVALFALQLGLQLLAD